jgi:endonuclease/exonuclease/phosphatase family metal-dependent hydrolase
MGIALRRPGEVERLPLPRRDARVVTLRPGDWPELAAPLEIVNVHVQAPHVSPWRSLPLRREQLALLGRYLEESAVPHRALVGDLNATPRWPLYRRLAERLDDGAEHFARATGASPRATWSPWPGGPRLLRIDHVLVSGVALVHCEVVDVPGSDHAGVLAELELSREP